MLFRVHVPELADQLASDQVVAIELLEYGREQSQGQGSVDAGRLIDAQLHSVLHQQRNGECFVIVPDVVV